MFDDAIDPQQVRRKQEKLFEQKRKYKNLESDKKTYIDESVKVIKKQKTTIEKLKKQNEALKDLIVKLCLYIVKNEQINLCFQQVDGQ